ncbi:MAG: DNA repair protein RecO [Candidatus Acetothermia bacterium]
MAIKKARAYTIRAINYQESDLIVTLFGREEGKFAALAKGARKTSSKFGAVFDLLNLSEVVYYEGSNLHFVSSAELLQAWEKLRREGVLIDMGLQSAKLINKLLEEDQPEPEAFQLFGNTLEMLTEGPDEPRVLYLGFYIKLLTILGLRPMLRVPEEPSSSENRSGPSLYFSPSAGGVVPEKNEEQVIPISDGLRKLLIKTLEFPQDKVCRLKAPRQTMDKGIQLMDKMVDFHLHPAGAE